MIEPKSDAGVRDVPLAGWVLDEMAEHCARHGVQPGGYVFKSSKTQRPVRADRFRWIIRRAAAEAGLERPDGGVFHWHDLRHTYASTAIRAGLNPKQIQTYMGHENIKQTFDTYGSLFADDDDRARELLNRARPAGVVRNSGGIRAV